MAWVATGFCFDRGVGTRPLGNGSAVTPPPRPSRDREGESEQSGEVNRGPVLRDKRANESRIRRQLSFDCGHRWRLSPDLLGRLEGPSRGTPFWDGDEAGALRYGYNCLNRRCRLINPTSATYDEAGKAWELKGYCDHGGHSKFTCRVLGVDGEWNLESLWFWWP
jgi:hypothetical protein